MDDRYRIALDTVVAELASDPEAPAPAPTEEQINLLRYGLTHLAADLDDVEHDPIASRILGAAVVQQAMIAFCKLNRLHGAKLKRLVPYVAAKDSLLGVMLRDYYTREMHPKDAQEIVDYVLAPAGGRLVEWESEKVPTP